MSRIRIIAVTILLISIVIGYFAIFKGSFKLGLDLSGGTQLSYMADTTNIQASEVSDLMNSLRDVIERRVNLFGVGEPIVQVEEGGLVGGAGNQRLIVELPGITQIEEAVNLIGQTPLLEFKLFKEGFNYANISPEQNIAESLIPSGLTGRMVKRASLQFGQGGSQGGLGNNEPVVALEFNKEGEDLFFKITSDNIGKPLAIVLDGEVISYPVINDAISGGAAVISGNFDAEEAKTLVRDLNFGALPVPIELVGTESVGPSLGAKTTEAGIRAGVWGTLLVALFLIFWYRLPGLISVVSLSIYIILMLAVFKLIPVTLTAAGIAGFIMSIGMAVDANILIFERVKEEIDGGAREMDEAIKNGFHRAWLSIRDSNISSMITAVILFWMGTSLVKGFALTFGLGVLVSMLTAISISRTFLFAIVPKKYNKMFGIGFRN